MAFFLLVASVGDLDPHVFGPLGSGSGSISQRCGSGSFHFLRNVKCEKEIIIFASLKLTKKGVGSGVGPETGFGSISRSYGSGDPDPDLHQNVTDPQHCL
jgi:hypothetical protein